MKRFVWTMLALLIVAALAIAAFGATTERITNLPQDQDMFYVSVVGNGADYQRLLGWFNSGDLKTLRDQVHFCPVTTNSAVYKERYASNTEAVPMVRVQEADGVVIYQACGSSIPATAEGLYNNIAAATQARELLPWRRRHAQPQPSPEPSPEPEPFVDVDVDIAPPPVNLPVVQPQMQLWPLVLVLFLLGFGIGQVKEAKARRKQ